MVDIDNDGDLDIYISHYNEKNQLFINDNNFFKEKAKEYGLDYEGPSYSMTFSDYNLDGHLDAYLLTNRDFGSAVKYRKSVYKKTQDARERRHLLKKKPEYYSLVRDKKDWYHITNSGGLDYLYKNNGNGKFINVSKESGIYDFDMGLSTVWFDYNQDGYPDIYVANDFEKPDRLYKNNKDGTFTDIANKALPATPWYSMGVDISDVNNDGYIDLLGTDMRGSNHYQQKIGMGDMDQFKYLLEDPYNKQTMRNVLYLNTDKEYFFEAAFLHGVDSTDWTWSPKFGDYDNDGYVDLTITNGMYLDFMNSDLELERKKMNDIQLLLGRQNQIQVNMETLF